MFTYAVYVLNTGLWVEHTFSPLGVPFVCRSASDPAYDEGDILAVCVVQTAVLEGTMPVDAGDHGAALRRNHRTTLPNVQRRPAPRHRRQYLPPLLSTTLYVIHVYP